MRDYDYLIELGQDYLAHYGVKGMKWRKRKVTRANRRGVDVRGSDASELEGHWKRVLAIMKAGKASQEDIDIVRGNYKYLQDPHNTYRVKRDMKIKDVNDFQDQLRIEQKQFIDHYLKNQKKKKK